MRSEAEIKIIKDLKADGKTFQEIADIEFKQKFSNTSLLLWPQNFKGQMWTKEEDKKFWKLRIYIQYDQKNALLIKIHCFTLKWILI